jgi:hypothetical protein
MWMPGDERLRIGPDKYAESRTLAVVLKSCAIRKALQV